MVKRILMAWFISNFVLAAVFAIISGSWYLHLPVVERMGAELLLIILPNLVIPLLVLRFAWPIRINSLRQALGWQWHGLVPLGIGAVGFCIYLAASSLLARLLGPGLPYSLPGEGGPIPGIPGLLALLLFLVFAGITVLGEENMFRGLIQTQISQLTSIWLGIALTVVLFGIRHLPADIFYAQVWNATPQMWLSRQVDLYVGAIILSLTRYFGRSTYASATMHFLLFAASIVS